MKPSSPNIDSLRETSWKRVSRDPFVDWVLMLSIGVASVAILIVISISACLNITEATSSATDQEVFVQHALINTTELANIVGRVGNGAVTGSSIPGDPSL